MKNWMAALAAAGIVLAGSYSVLAENNASYGSYCNSPAYSQGRSYGCGGYRGGCGSYTRDNREEGPYCNGPYGYGR